MDEAAEDAAAEAAQKPARRGHGPRASGVVEKIDFDKLTFETDDE